MREGRLGNKHCGTGQGTTSILGYVELKDNSSKKVLDKLATTTILLWRCAQHYKGLVTTLAESCKMHAMHFNSIIKY